MFSYDATLAAAVQTLPATVPDVIATMQTIQNTCADGDGLKWFNWLYLQVTQAVEGSAADGGLTDRDWFMKLDVQFAGLYFGALKTFLAGGSPAECWSVMFACRDNAKVARIQFALAGMNAHINHDLTLAIVSTCQLTGTVPDHDGSHYNDFTSLNATLDGLIESAKQTLHVRLLGDDLPPVSHLEDTLAGWSVTAARENAWRNAELLWYLESEPALADAFTDTLDGFSTVAGKALLVPAP